MGEDLRYLIEVRENLEKAPKGYELNVNDNRNDPCPVICVLKLNYDQTEPFNLSELPVTDSRINWLSEIKEEFARVIKSNLLSKGQSLTFQKGHYECKISLPYLD